MALIKCKECDEEISKKATKCPKCGAPAKKKTSVFTWVIATLVALWVIGYFSGNQGTSTTNQGTSTTNQGTNTTEPNSFGTASSGAVTWKGTGYKYARSMITYNNNTNHTFSLIQIQCVAYNSSGQPVSDFLINYAVSLGQQPIPPGSTKIKEAVFDNGSQVNSVSCSIERAKT